MTVAIDGSQKKTRGGAQFLPILLNPCPFIAMASGLPCNDLQTKAYVQLPTITIRIAKHALEHLQTHWDRRIRVLFDPALERRRPFRPFSASVVNIVFCLLVLATFLQTEIYLPLP